MTTNKPITKIAVKTTVSLASILIASSILTACEHDNRNPNTNHIKPNTNIPKTNVTTQPNQSSPINPKNTINQPTINYTYGVRPFYLIDDMDKSPLKETLKACQNQTPKPSKFSISHRGAPLQIPEHTVDSYLAAARMGAGILECDVAFTKDKQLVCRHAQNDLHTTTNILATDLANKCTVPPQFDASGKLINAENIECRTSDITLAEFKTLTGKMDAANKKATNIHDYMNATASWRTDLYSQNGKLVSLKEHIELTKKLGLKHTPELKEPAETMPFHGYSQNDYRQQLIDTYKQAGVSGADVYAQSFNIDDVVYWLQNDAEFGKTAVYLIDDSNETADGKTFDKNDPTTWKHSMAELKAMGINIIAPATWLLVTTDGNGHLQASEYAKQAKANGLEIITWSLERSGPLAQGGGWYYTGLDDAINNDGDIMNYIDVLAKDVGVIGIFSDWPATITYYANCQGL